MITPNQNLRTLGARMRNLAIVATAFFTIGLGQSQADDTEIEFEPFKGDMAIIDPTQTPVFDDEGNFVGIQDEAGGNATQLGKFTAIVIFKPLPPDFAVFNGEIVMTAANGDTVELEFEGVSIGEETEEGFTISFAAEIVGGTGRFEGATGEIFLDGIILPSDDETDFGATFFDFDGLISE